MTPFSKEQRDVHRLVDMVVEEVSLVDRAANKHCFLIVKRDESMDDDKTTDTHTPAPTPAGTAAKLDDSALGAALSALESLTALVELLGTLGADSVDERLPQVASELRALAEHLLVRTGLETTSTDVEARAAADAPKEQSTAIELATLDTSIAAAKQALARLGELVKTLPVKADNPTGPSATAAPSTKADETTVNGSLAQLAQSLRALSDTVHEQQQRLGRVEKQFGLPNSAAPAERVATATVQDVGWPLDLNMPKDRESVDKAISFHDL